MLQKFEAVFKIVGPRFFSAVAKRPSFHYEKNALHIVQLTETSLQELALALRSKESLSEIYVHAPLPLHRLDLLLESLPSLSPSSPRKIYLPTGIQLGHLFHTKLQQRGYEFAGEHSFVDPASIPPAKTIVAPIPEPTPVTESLPDAYVSFAGLHIRRLSPDSREILAKMYHTPDFDRTFHIDTPHLHEMEGILQLIIEAKRNGNHQAFTHLKFSHPIRLSKELQTQCKEWNILPEEEHYPFRPSRLMEESFSDTPAPSC